MHPSQQNQMLQTRSTHNNPFVNRWHRYALAQICTGTHAAIIILRSSRQKTNNPWYTHVEQDITFFKKTEQICCDIYGCRRLQQMGHAWTHTWKALYRVHIKTRNNYALPRTVQGVGHTCINTCGQHAMITPPASCVILKSELPCNSDILIYILVLFCRLNPQV
jgi:hypothetical protein